MSARPQGRQKVSAQTAMGCFEMLLNAAVQSSLLSVRHVLIAALNQCSATLNHGPEALAHGMSE